MVQVWFKYGSSMVQVWLKHGSSEVQVWLRQGGQIPRVYIFRYREVARSAEPRGTSRHRAATRGTRRLPALEKVAARPYAKTALHGATRRRGNRTGVILEWSLRTMRGND